jgi:hypothetical protein
MNLPKHARAAAFAASISATLVAGMAGTALAFDDLDCGDFAYQEDAQAVLSARPAGPHRLDEGADGVACESLPDHRPAAPAAARDATEATTPMTTPQVVPAGP